MKRIWRFLLAAVLTAGLLSGCAKDTQPVSLYDRGSETASLVCRIVESRDFLDAFAGSQEIVKVVQDKVPSSPASPAHTYRVSVSEDDLLKGCDIMNADALSQTLREQVLSRCYEGMGTRLLAISGGSLEIAAASLCQAEITFVSEELKDNQAYLYIYEDGAPILVSFVPGEDHAVKAQGTILPGKDFLSMESMESLFSILGAELVELD